MNKVAYKDTFLTFYHYKEPLKQVREGFGYEGALLGSLDGEKVQCHICGELFANLASHTIKSHRDLTPTARDYKERFGLAFNTALISEAERDRMKVNAMVWWNKLSPDQKKLHIETTQKRRAEWYAKNLSKRNPIQPKLQLETKNKRGTCPDQLLDKINSVAKTLGHTPSKKDFIDHFNSQRYVHLIYATFGSWATAIEKAGLVNKEHRKTTGRKPPRYSDEELLDLLSLFYQENGKVPSYTDCRRGILPNAEIYICRFGSMAKARELAGIHYKPTRYGEVPV